MFELKDMVLSGKLKGIDSDIKFIEALGIPAMATLNQVKTGKQSFRLINFKNACDLFGISMDWFFGYTDKMNRFQVDQSPLELLNEATRLINAEFKNTRPLTKTLTKKARK